MSAAFAIIIIGALFVSLKLYSPPEKAAKFNTVIEIDSVEASVGDTLSISFRVDVHPKDKQFTIIALPDTQYYSKFYPEIYIAQTQWIV
ncbi:MAG: hypothetical protein GY803_11950, partial [Chloroflexi bacterium]|nr:hypothetical protein [Chloroflexota bacterium]